MMSAAAAQAHPELKTIDDIIARPDLFPHPEDPSKVGCTPAHRVGDVSYRPTTYSVRLIWKRKAGSSLIRARVLVWMDQSRRRVSVARTGLDIIGPQQHLLAKYDLKLVDFNSGFDKDNWDNCIVKPVEECDNPKRSKWTVSEVVSLAQVDFAKRAPGCSAYVKNGLLTQIC